LVFGVPQSLVHDVLARRADPMTAVDIGTSLFRSKGVEKPSKKQRA
jgi:hypothetical protein